MARFRRARATPGRSRRNSDDPQFGASSDVIFRLPKRPGTNPARIRPAAAPGRPGPNLCENNVCFHMFFSRRFGSGRPRTATELIPSTSDLPLPGAFPGAPGRTRKTTQNHQKPSEIAFTLTFWRRKPNPRRQNAAVVAFFRSWVLAVVNSPLTIQIQVTCGGKSPANSTNPDRKK